MGYLRIRYYQRMEDLSDSILQNRIILGESDLKYRLVGYDFMGNVAGEHYSKIIANPPFSKNQDIDHIYQMYINLVRGGRLVSIASNHWFLSQNKKEIIFREWLEEKQTEIIKLDSGEFKESGTTISCCIILINKDSESLY